LQPLAMGQLFSSLWSTLFGGGRELKLVMVGLDNAGKTTVLYRMSLGQTIETTATVGSNVEQIKHGNLTFEVWDLGGQANLRPSWATYYTRTDCIILVVDSTDRGRVGTARKELGGLLGHEHLEGVPVLIIANKQDLRDAMSAAELSSALALSDIKGHDWHLQVAVATKGEGLTEGFDWIAQRLTGEAAPPRKAMPHGT